MYMQNKKKQKKKKKNKGDHHRQSLCANKSQAIINHHLQFS